MSSKIEELKAKQARELEQLEREEAARDIITAEITARGLTVVRFSPHVAYADYTVTVEPVADLPAAIYTVEILNPLAIFKVKDSCTAFVPETHLDRYLEKNKNAKEECAGAYIYHIDGLRQYEEEKTLECYIVTGEYTVRVEIPVMVDHDTYRDFDISFRRDGSAVRKYCRLVNKSGHFLHYVQWWTSEEHPNKFTLY